MNPPLPEKSDEMSQIAEIENRVRGLEEHLAIALEEIRQMRSREQISEGLLREILGDMTRAERSESFHTRPY
jgi:hypothetical protein